MNNTLPVVVIGAGPVGLAAAAHLLERGLTPLVLEAGDSVGSGMLRWSHVRMFSSWELTIDRAAGALLTQHGWSTPDLAGFPTGGEVVDRYLRPLAALPEIAPYLRLGARVSVVTKQRRDRMKDAQRDDVPFAVRYEDADGEHEVLAQGVIDASGTIETPNPMGASGVLAIGEKDVQDRIFYGMPNVMGEHRDRYAGKHVLVVGSGHSAFNVLNDLARLSQEVAGMKIQWAIRRDSLRRVLGGGEADQLKERGRLGMTIDRLVEDGVLEVATGFYVERLERTADGIVVGDDKRALAPVDEIVAATGFRPDLSVLSELRIELDLGTHAPVALAPLIDPNQHSCGSVRPHGAEELKHPDAGVYIVGMKSYGRAPTFLMLTGYEQVRSVVAALAGDWEAARRVELVLPETGVCITDFAEEDASKAAAASCCGPAPTSDCGPSSCAPATSTTTDCSSSSCSTPAPAAAASDCGIGSCGAPAKAETIVEAEEDCCGGPAPTDSDACCAGP